MPFHGSPCLSYRVATGIQSEDVQLAGPRECVAAGVEDRPRFVPESGGMFFAGSSIIPSVTSHVICRMFHGSLLVVQRRQGGWHEALRGDFGEGRACRARGDHAQGVASVAEGAQRADSAQLGRGRVQRAPGARGGYCRDPAHQCAQGGSGQEAFCRGGHGGGSRRSAGSPFQLRAQGRRRVRGALGGAELRRASGGPLAVVAAVAGGSRRGARPHRQCVARDGAAGSKKTQSNRGGESAG